MLKSPRLPRPSLKRAAMSAYDPKQTFLGVRKTFATPSLTGMIIHVYSRLLHCNIALQHSRGAGKPGVGQKKNQEFREMREKIAALKNQTWIYPVGAFAILVVIGLVTS